MFLRRRPFVADRAYYTNFLLTKYSYCDMLSVLKTDIALSAEEK